MEAQEAEHLARFDKLLTDKQGAARRWRSPSGGSRPSRSKPARPIDDKAAHACTEAVENVIEEHYAHQIAELSEREPELAAELAKFRDGATHRDLAGEGREARA